MHRWMPLVALLACNGPDPIEPTDTDTDADADTDADSDTDADADTDDPGTDEDGDGWTIEEGDCDDDDIWVNPAWDEVEDDDKDNDCDGLVDERFAGVQFLDIDETGGPGVWVTIDSFGDLVDKLTLDIAIGASAVVPSSDGDGWVFTDPGRMAVTHVDTTGKSTVLWTDVDTEYADGEEPLGYFGLATLPDGAYVLTGADRLWKVDPGGGATVLAEWDCLEGEEGITEICPLDVTVNRFTGEIALFGYFGGFATWTAATGLDLKIPDDIVSDVPPYTFVNAATKDSTQAYFAYGVDAEGVTGLYRWDAASTGFKLKGEWTSGSWTPSDFVIEQETGDIYWTANGGWYYTVYRMVADGSYLGQLYSTDGSVPNHAFGPISIVYEAD